MPYIIMIQLLLPQRTFQTISQRDEIVPIVTRIMTLGRSRESSRPSGIFQTRWGQEEGKKDDDRDLGYSFMFLCT